MNLSTTAKVLFGLGVAVAFFAYLVLLDFGINAGRIHYGVSVAGFDVGGLTKEEAREALRERGRALKTTAVIPSYEGFDCRFVPEELGWRVLPIQTAERARHVGIEGGLFSALGNRLDAWFGGIDVDWAGRARHDKVTSLIDRCEVQADGVGVAIDRFRLRKKIADWIVTWPREFFEIPIEES